nr:hypothetical protein [Tanacetum cinerariifolium]
MQTQTSNTLHNAIMEAGGKDRPPMLAPSNYVQWKSRIKRYIDTKPNHELIHYCLKNPPYKYTWADKVVPVSEGSPKTTTKRYMDNYKNVSQDIRDQLNVEAEAVQIILTGIDNDIYSTVDAKWQRFVTLVKQSQKLKTVSYHKLYDILKQHQNEVNELRAERIARTANPLALVAQQQLVYHPQNHPTHYTQNSSTRSQQASTRNRGKAIVNSPSPIYDQEPSMVAEDDEITVNQDNSPRINRGIGYEKQRIGNVTGARKTVGTTVVQKSGIQCYNCKEFGHVARECLKPKRVKDAAYHKEKMLLCKQEEAGFQLNAEQADWRDNTDDEYEDQELEAYYMYMAQIQEVSPDADEDSGPIFDTDPFKREQIDQNDDDDDDLANERDLLASLIEKLKCEIYDNKNRNKFLETSNKVLVDKLKGEIEDFKTQNKSLESSNNRFKEANNKLSETNALMYNDLKKFQAELDRRNDVKYASKMEIDCAKAKGDLISYKMESQKSFNKYTQTINDLNQTISEMKKELCAHQETISILSQPKEAQIKLYKTCEDKELDKVIALENKVKETKFLNEIDRLSREYYYADHMNAILGVIPPTSVSRPQLKSNPMEDRVMLNNSQGKKQEVEDHRRNVKLSKNKRSVTACNDSLNAKISNVNFVCTTCGKYVLNEKHDMCVFKSRNGVNSMTKMPMVVPVSTREPKRIVKQSVAKPLRRIVASESTNQKPRNTTRKLYEYVTKTCSWWYPKFTPTRYKWKPKSQIGNVNPNLIEIILFMVDSGCSKNMTGNLKLLINIVKKFLGTVKFRNDQIAPILGYGDLVQGAVTIKRVYYVEGLNHNLLTVGQLCDADLELAFRKSTCYIRDLKGNDLLTGSRRIDLYSITLQDTSSPNPICLMAKATSSQAWLWHRRLSHLNFDTINLLSKNDIVIGLPKLKFIKDHLCSSCELGKAKRKLVQRGLHAQVRTVRTDKGMEFLNKTLHAYFVTEGINHQTSVARTPEQNGVVERRNRTLVEAARTMLSAAKVPLDGENLDKMKEKGDACIFVGYSTQSRAYTVFNKRTRVIVETIHVNFDELPQMASDHVSSDPVPPCQRMALEHDSLSLGTQCQDNVPHAAEIVTTSNKLDLLFSLMFPELLNGSTQVVSKSSAVSTADATNQWFPAQSVGSSNSDVLDSPGLLVLITETSQSRQHDPFSSGRIIGLIPNLNHLMTSLTS